MTGPLNLKVVTSGDTRGLDKTAKALDDVADNAEEAERSILGLGKESEKTARKTDQLGDEFNRAGRDAAKLKRDVLEAEAALKLLARQYVATGDEMAKADLKKQQAQVAELKRLDAILSPRMPKPKPGSGKDGAGLGIGLGPLANPYVLAGAGLGLTVGGPFIGSAIGGATMIGGAAGVAGAGVFGAVKREPELFKAAWADAIASVKSDWLTGSADFVRPSLLGLRQLTSAVKDVGIDDMLRDAAKYVEPLATGFAGLIREAGPGFRKMLKDAEPVIDAFTEALPLLGNSLSAMFRDIGDGSEGASDAIFDLVMILSGGVRIVGSLVEKTSNWYDKLVEARQKLPGDLFGDEYRKIEAVGRSFDTTAQSTREYAEAAAKAKQEAEELFGVFMSLDEATLAVNQGWINLKKELTDGERTLDQNKQAGIDNAEAILNQVDALERKRKAMIESGIIAANANEWFDKEREKIRAIGLAAGFTAEEMDKLLAKYDLDKTLTLTTIFRDVYTKEGIPRQAASRYGGTDRYADGGPVRNTGWALVGEEGPELVRLSKGDYVYDAGKTAGMMRAPSQMSMSSTSIGLPPLSVLEQAFAAVVMKLYQKGQIQL